MPVDHDDSESVHVFAEVGQHRLVTSFEDAVEVDDREESHCHIVCSSVRRRGCEMRKNIRLKVGSCVSRLCSLRDATPWHAKGIVKNSLLFLNEYRQPTQQTPPKKAMRYPHNTMGAFYKFVCHPALSAGHGTRPIAPCGTRTATYPPQVGGGDGACLCTRAWVQRGQLRCDV